MVLNFKKYTRKNKLFDNKLVLALDVENIDEAKSIVSELKDLVGVFKVGKQMFTKYGPLIVEYIHSQNCKVFLDLKFHDIPNTVAGAAKSAVELGVFMFNVHCLGGKDMMKAAKDSAVSTAEKLGITPPIILGVTVLTSITPEVLKSDLKVSDNLNDYVAFLAKSAKQSFLDGVVASPNEIGIIRKTCGKNFIILTPGIRPAWSSKDDQARITTPADAIKMGSDFIVIGRPILMAKDRRAAVERILGEIA